jgi:hypothetical protein
MKERERNTKIEELPYCNNVVAEFNGWFNFLSVGTVVTGNKQFTFNHF